MGMIMRSLTQTKIFDAGHDDNEEPDPNQDEYEIDIGEDTNARKYEADNDSIYYIYLVYICFYFYL